MSNIREMLELKCCINERRYEYIPKEYYITMKNHVTKDASKENVFKPDDP